LPWLALVVAAALWASPPVLAESSLRIEPDQVYGHKMGMALTLDIVRPPTPSGAGVLFMVSGGWVSRWSDPQAAAAGGELQRRFGALLDRGLTLFLVRHGSSPLFKVPDAVDDVRQAVRFVRANAGRFGVDPERLGVFGGSAGGHLSLMLGLAGPGVVQASDADGELEEPVRVAAVAAYFPPVDLRPLVGPSDRFPALDFDPELADDVSPLLYVSTDDPPVLLVHGTADRLVPLSNSEILHRELTAKGVTTRLIVLDGAGHGFEGDQATQAITAVAEWFAQHLSPRERAPQSITTPQR
jgi:acetyl esterase/lipase